MLPAEWMARVEPGLAGTAETMLVQGTIDCLFREASGWILVDYKTDRGSDATELVERYATQLELYAVAVENILKQPVREKYLYLFNTGETIQV